MIRELVQYIPFDEAEIQDANLSGPMQIPTETLARDLSGKGNDLVLTEGNVQFVKGKVKNALYLKDADAVAEVIGTTIVNLAEDFTYTFWFKSDIIGETPTATWLLYRFAGDERYLYLDANTPGTAWTYIAIVQEGTRVSLFVNGIKTAVEEFPTGWGFPTGFVLLNNNPHDSGGFLTVDELKVYTGLNTDALTPPATQMVAEYKINYETFKSFGVYVKQGDGFFDALKMKEPFKVDWPDYHGEVLDLSDPRYEARNLTLECFIYAHTKEDFDEKIKRFLNKFYGAGTKRLSLDASGLIFNYEIYMASEAKVKKKFRSADMVGEFTLELIEPQPIKRIIYFLKSGGNSTVSVTLTSRKPLTIYWGDGTHLDNVMGTVTKTHTYSTDGAKYVIVAGVIEEVTNLSTNGIITNGANSYF